ncbi:bacterial transcriptional activator domain-containing protein [Massilia sp. Se16.2.3]|uniref:AfsR/SARP family transcriptional regulator n=1 Tax=Massilia sp. Se16.2.3 TaxID=2709303 RepID=UPI001600538E|nr:bacterial transcriptional activator domain-containing protein [Massilia sp. Se16.2.3]QNA99907.1 hypothetical protein G4G31_15610 [Massilia sp. Se16.2.3]
MWGNADIARSALNVTVHRLRRLLQSDEAVVVSGGRIVLAQTQVWSDLAALARLCEELPALGAATPPADLRQRARALLDLYRGPFCEGIDDAWTLVPRERARSLFPGAVARLGQQLEGAREWELAQDLYARALAAEPLAEANYRGAMRCAHACDGAAAAFGVYRRCRETLSIVLGLAPAAETEQLAVSPGLKGARAG